MQARFPFLAVLPFYIPVVRSPCFILTVIVYIITVHDFFQVVGYSFQQFGQINIMCFFINLCKGQENWQIFVQTSIVYNTGVGKTIVWWEAACYVKGWVKLTGEEKAVFSSDSVPLWDSCRVHLQTTIFG